MTPVSSVFCFATACCLCSEKVGGNWGQNFGHLLNCLALTITYHMTIDFQGDARVAVSHLRLRDLRRGSLSSSALGEAARRT
jgi:hypothetical protein